MMKNPVISETQFFIKMNKEYCCKLENKLEITAVLPKEIVSTSFVYVNRNLPKSVEIKTSLNQFTITGNKQRKIYQHKLRCNVQRT